MRSNQDDISQVPDKPGDCALFNPLLFQALYQDFRKSVQFVPVVCSEIR